MLVKTMSLLTIHGEIKDQNILGDKRKNQELWMRFKTTERKKKQQCLYDLHRLCR